MFDYRGGEPDEQFDTVLRILDISDEFVKRQLITQNRIESTILIENRAQADEVMYRRPAKVFACFAINPERRGCGYRVGGV
jgi:structural maintenance of chromosomes protein 6